MDQEIPDELTEHNYSIVTRKEQINIDMEYADDIGKLSSDYNAIQKFKQEIPTHLKSRNLIINETKTEEFKINRQTSEWKKCKYLGTLLDTKEDIQRRKSLAITAANKLNDIFQNKRLTITTKITVFKTYIISIFLYNSETWTITSTEAEKIDAFHRKLLRIYVLNVRWPNIETNDHVYERTKTKYRWSQDIKKRRLKWFGKVIRMDETIPAKKALRYATQPFKRPPGKPPSTWINTIKKDFQSLNISWELACENALEEKEWERMINNNL